jgi:transposase
VPLSLSTLADQVGAASVVLVPLFERLCVHVMAAERLHGDDTTVPVLARGKHPQAHLSGYAGILHADAYGGYAKLYETDRSPGIILEAGCWAHARRKFLCWPMLQRPANEKRKARRRT